MKKVLPPVAFAFAVAGCTSLTPVEEDPLYLRLTDLEARMIRIERVVENQSLIQLATEVDSLRTQLASLRGEVENMRFDIDGNAERQRELYLDVDSRLQSLEQAQARGGVAAVPPRTSAQGGFDPVVPSEPPVAAAPARPAGSDQQNYQAAFDLIQARRYEEAGRAFTEFLQAFPDSPLADNAQYWLAETHYVQRSFTTALPEFQKVIDNYPQSAKMPDALLKIGYCQHELGDLDSARATLQRVMRQFPDTTAARLAAQRLDRIG